VKKERRRRREGRWEGVRELGRELGKEKKISKERGKGKMKRWGRDGGMELGTGKVKEGECGSEREVKGR
jgi:hypothetical protein